jgi:hypothetical protein
VTGNADGALPVVDDLDAIVGLISAHGDVFLRYSKGPASDARHPRSRDYEAGVDMPGLSVTPVTPEPWWSRPGHDWVARRLFKYAELHDDDRFPWLLTGRIVGAGPDHEPLVEMDRPLARVGDRALAEARERYESHFEVGRDSRS